MIDNCAVRFLLAAESLAYMLAAWGWWRVWQKPSALRVGHAAFYTALCFPLKFVRIALVIILGGA